MDIKKMLEIERSLCAPEGPCEIQEEDVLGERMDVFKNRVRSLRELIEQSLAFGEKEYIVYDNLRITYVDHYRMVASVAKALKEKYGVEKGDRVAIFAANIPEWIITFWASASLGAITVGLNGWWVTDEVEYGLKDSDPKVLLADEKRLARLNGLDIKPIVITMERVFDQLVNYDPKATLPTIPIAEDDPVCILYTSGTTGRPKGVVNSHRNIIAHIDAQRFHGMRLSMISRTPPLSNPAILLTMPLFHVSGLFASMANALANGLKTVWMEGRFDPVKAMQLIQDESITSWSAMETVSYRLINHPDVYNYDFSKVTSMGSGGAPTSKDIQARLRKLFPNARGNAGHGYGSTECSGLVSINFGEEFEQKPYSSGRLLPTVQVEIRDGKGKPLEKNMDGEIYVRSPMVMLEYWRNKEATAKTIVEGHWLDTGDFGRIDSDGYLIINSRLRDLILRGSENIYPVEIENRLAAHPKVIEAAVVGSPHKELGQEVKAIVVVQPGSVVTAEELRKWVSETLAYYKIPSLWEIIETPLPRNAVGKILKNVLKEGTQNIFSEE
jgi:acyl-CoA synthetase (AMP-forming)/AMP-acid ligase II